MNRRVGGQHPPVDPDPGKVGRTISLRFCFALIDEAAERHGLPGQDQVFQQGQRRRQHEFLMDQADAVRKGVRRPLEPNRSVVEDHGSFVRGVDALQDAHQSRLSGAVAADDRVDRLRRDGEVDAIVGDDGAEPAGDAASAQANCDRSLT